jgi:hypothetical protein
VTKGHELSCTLFENSSLIGTNKAQDEAIDFKEFNPIGLWWIRRTDDFKAGRNGDGKTRNWFL